MAESVKEAVPEARPRGQRRGLDRLRASGDGQPDHDGQAMGAGAVATEAAPAQQTVAPSADAGAPPAIATPGDAASAPRTSALVRATSLRALVAVIALLVLLVGWLGYRFWDTHSATQADKRRYEQLNATDARNSAVLSAARQGAVTLLTYDYRHLDKDFAAVLNGSTGGFKKDFASRQSEAKTLFTQGKAIANGQVLDAAVASSTSTSATVLLVLDQSVKNVSVPNGTVKHYRMQLQLTKVGSAWLVSDVEFPA
jgi:hypothetical protein